MLRRSCCHPQKASNESLLSLALAGETYKALALGEKNQRWNRSRAVKLRREQSTWPYSPDEGPGTTGENLNRGGLK